MAVQVPPPGGMQLRTFEPKWLRASWEDWKRVVEGVREAVGGPHRSLVFYPAILGRSHQHGSWSVEDILGEDT